MKVREDTYNNQVAEQRSHSFAFCFPPEGDFAPEAHHTLAPPEKLPHQTRTQKKKPKTPKQTKKQTNSQKKILKKPQQRLKDLLDLFKKKTAQATGKGAAVN